MRRTPTSRAEPVLTAGQAVATALVMDGLRSVKRSLLKRPHLDRRALKFSFEVVVHSFDLGPNVSCDRVSVLWTRGSKAAHTAEVAVRDGRSIVEEKLCLLCTLFRDDKKHTFDRKLCSFTVVQRSDIRLGRASIDLSEYVSLQPNTNRRLDVDVLRGGIVVGILRLSIASRWLKEYRHQAGMQAHETSSLGSGSLGEEAGLSDEDGAFAEAGNLDVEDDPAGLGFGDEDAAAIRGGITTTADPGVDGATGPCGGDGTSARVGPDAGASVGARRQSPDAAESAGPGSGSRSGSDVRTPGSRPSGSDASDRQEASLQEQLAEERATRRALEAELAAQTLVRSELRRHVSDRSVASVGPDAAADAAPPGVAQQQLQALREQLAEADARHAAAQERWNSELSRVRGEKEAAVRELRQLMEDREAVLEDQLASVEETYGERLARAEEQRQTISRRLGRAAKSKESVIAQLEAEKAMLEQRADALEDELCEALDAKRRQSEHAAALTRRVGELETARREDVHGASPQTSATKFTDGADALSEQLSVVCSVRDTLKSDIVKLERALVDAKLALAQAEEDKAHLRRQLKASKARQLLLAERMTELEVRLSAAFDEAAVAEERIAEAFSGVIRNLEAQLQAKAKAGPGAGVGYDKPAAAGGANSANGSR